MAKRRRKSQRRKQGGITILNGRAPEHGALKSDGVHIFVDDQNLFWGIVNQDYGRGFRIDFGRLMLAAARDSEDQPRAVASAYIAGVIPDDDSFWEIAENRGFQVRRGYLGSNNRSKQDDAYLITDMVATLYEKEGPATVVLMAGDADYVPPLKRALEKGWRTEVAFIERGVSQALEPVVHEMRTISPGDIELMQF